MKPGIHTHTQGRAHTQRNTITALEPSHTPWPLHGNRYYFQHLAPFPCANGRNGKGRKVEAAGFATRAEPRTQIDRHTDDTGGFLVHGLWTGHGAAAGPFVPQAPLGSGSSTAIAVAWEQCRLHEPRKRTTTIAKRLSVPARWVVRFAWPHSTATRSVFGGEGGRARIFGSLSLSLVLFRERVRCFTLSRIRVQMITMNSPATPSGDCGVNGTA